MKKKRILSLFLCFLLIGGMLMHSLNYAVAEETESSGSTLEESSDEGVVGSSEDAVSSNYEEDNQQEETDTTQNEDNNSEDEISTSSNWVPEEDNGSSTSDDVSQGNVEEDSTDKVVEEKPVKKTTSKLLANAAKAADPWKGPPSSADWDNGDTSGKISYCKALGIDMQEVLNLLSAHESDKYYIGTPYPSTPALYSGNLPNGAATSDNKDNMYYNGGKGLMNCTGFVWAVLREAKSNTAKEIRDKAKIDSIPADSGAPTSTGGSGIWSKYQSSPATTWVHDMINHPPKGGAVKTIKFKTVDAMLKSGKLEKGDIIWSFDDGDVNKLSDVHHIGFYWGDGTEDIYWHSMDAKTKWGDKIDNDYTSKELTNGNQISQIMPKTGSIGWMVFKGDGSQTFKLNIKKSSACPAISNNNRLYSLDGAVYGVYTHESCKKKYLVEEVELNAKGEGSVEDLESDGVYYVKEITAPEGFDLDKTVHPVDPKGSSNDVNLNVKDYPYHDPFNIHVMKYTRIKGQNASFSSMGDATLLNNRFQLDYYDEFLTKDQIKAGGKTPKYSVVFQTVKSSEENFYEASFEKAASIVSNSFPLNKDGQFSIPLGTVSVREISASQGYKISNSIMIQNGVQITDNMIVCQIKNNGESELGAIDVFHRVDSYNEIQSGGFKIKKVDHETGKSEAREETSLANGEFQLINRSAAAVEVAGTVYDVGDVIKTYTTDETGSIEEPADFLPYGSYEIKETKAPTGFLPEGVTSRTFQIRNDGEIVDLNAQDKNIRNLPIRGDLQLLKLEGQEDFSDIELRKPIVGAEFTISSKTTGQAVLTIVSNEEGIATTVGKGDPKIQIIKSR